MKAGRLRTRPVSLGRRVLADVRRLHTEVNALLAREMRARGLVATCSRGCAACCQLLVIASTAEAIAIAQHLIERDQHHVVLPALIKAAATMTEGAPTDEEYRRLQRNCAFLSQERRCSIYDLRPSGCRYHISISPPEYCNPESSTPPEIVNSTPFQVPIAAVMLHLEAELGLPELDGGAPLPLMIIHALHRLRPEDEDVRAACASLTEPATWASPYLERRIRLHERELPVIRSSSSREGVSLAFVGGAG